MYHVLKLMVGWSLRWYYHLTGIFHNICAGNHSVGVTNHFSVYGVMMRSPLLLDSV